MAIKGGSKNTFTPLLLHFLEEHVHHAPPSAHKKKKKKKTNRHIVKKIFKIFLHPPEGIT